MAPWLGLASLTVLACVLRLWQVGAEPLSVDEAASAWVAGQPVAQTLHWIAEVDTHPPLYYLLLHGWVAVFGNGEAALRMPSVLASTAVVPVVYLTGWALAGPWVGALAGALVATSPWQVLYAQDARMYALLTLGAALAMLGAALVLPGAARGRPGGAGSGGWAGQVLYVVGTVTVVLTHNIGAFVVAAVNLAAAAWWLAGGRPRGALRRWSLLQVVVGAVWAAWLPVALAQAGQLRDFWIPTPTTSDLLDALRLPYAGTADLSVTPVPVGVDLVVVLLLAGALLVARHRGVAAGLLAAWVVPVAAVWVVSVVWRPILIPRAVLWTAVPAVLLLALTATARRRPTAAVSVVALTALVVLNLAGLAHLSAESSRTPWEAIAAQVADGAREGDVVVTVGNVLALPLRYYLDDQAGAPPVVAFPVPPTREWDAVVSPADLPALAEATAGHERVWLLYHAWPRLDPDGVVLDHLQRRGELTHEVSYRDGRIRLLRFDLHPDLAASVGWPSAPRDQRASSARRRRSLTP